MNPYLNDAEIELIKALRSGEFKQIKNCLHTSEGYCCLGVACEISKLGNWSYQFYNEDTDDYNYTPEPANHNDEATYLDVSSEILPIKVQWRLNWSDEAGILEFVDLNKGRMNLTILNDNGFTFDQIADVIEAGLILKME